MRRLILFLYTIIFIWILGGFSQLFRYIADLSNLDTTTFNIIITVLNALLLVYILFRLIKFEKVLNGITQKSFVW